MIKKYRIKRKIKRLFYPSIIIGLIMGAIFWQKSENIINNNTPIIFELYNHNLISAQQIDTILQSFKYLDLQQIDLHDIADGFKKFSELQKIEIRKKYPNHIIIHFEEKVPVATFNAKNSMYLLSNDGSKLQPTKTIIGLEIIGEDADKELILLEKHLNLLERKTEFAQSVKKAILINKRRWDLEMNSGIVIKLPENLANISSEKIVKIMHSINNYFTTKSKLSMIDLRLYPKKLFLQMN